MVLLVELRRRWAMSFGSIVIDARRGLTIPAVAVVAAVPLQVPTLCTSSGFDPIVELLLL